jgi:hypothetical protein
MSLALHLPSLWLKLAAVTAKEATTKAYYQNCSCLFKFNLFFTSSSLQKVRYRTNGYTDQTSVFRVLLMHSFL